MEDDTITIPILQDKKIGHSTVKEFVQGSTLCFKWPELNLESMALKIKCLTTTH